eukprot:CAMPEP_0198306190 /NCGR_PEP_ID=MMETSP1449-20131203/58291_1 /TAXON_ID=420275 /ORGANISM="Attheya septentrionalis, Strain CCMP2084" /LENGTH=558 /DNA_ID=CAMNT_0044008739 /DNA_START=45 /DNA_END=1721 /DNA_ORIENTATION=+
MERMEPHEFFDEEMDRDEHPVVTPSTGSASGNDAKAAPRFMKQHHRKPRRKVFTFMEKCMVEMGLPGGEDESSYHENNTGEGKWYNPNVLMTRYLFWTFRTSFCMFIFSACILFYALLVLFAVLIYWSIFDRPFCVQVEGDLVKFDAFSDAFALSWATFTTVGYGSIYPSVSTDTIHVKECGAVIFLTSMESFIGCLYTSAIGALVFGKVVRAQSQAQVVFSDPIVVRYGSGINKCDNHNENTFDWSDEEDNNNEGQTSASMDDERKEEESNPTMVDDDGIRSRNKRSNKRMKIPCPILEFRLVNNLHATRGGEIMDATLKVVAVLDADTACPSILQQGRRHGSYSAGIHEWSTNTSKEKVSFGDKPLKNVQTLIKGTMKPVDGVVNWALEQASPTMTQAATRNVIIEEGNNPGMMTRKLFCKLHVHAPDHPFFKRMWTIKHTLDGTSPLLTNKARKMLRQNKGCGWPEDLNNYNAVRESIQFNKILVFMSGTSNASASSVYAQTTYGSIDLNVGYKFANALYRTEQGRIRVDTTLVNDVLEQNGGGGEPFILKAAID